MAMPRFRSFFPAIMIVLVLFMAMAIGGCNGNFLPWVHSAATNTVAATSPAAPTGPIATQPATTIVRPIVQTVAAAAGPTGNSILAIVAAIASLIAGLTTTTAVQKSAQLTSSNKAVAELHKVVQTTSPTSVAALTPATQRVVAAATTS